VRIETIKAVASDVTKYKTKQIGAAMAEAIDTNPWNPTATDPTKFTVTLLKELFGFKTGISDALIASQKPNAKPKYRELMFILYNSPFIWNAPTKEEVVKWENDLWRPLEVFLWADWANHQEAKYWLRRTLRVTDPALKESNAFERRVTDMYEADLMDLDLILERLLKCQVRPEYVSQLMPNYESKWLPRSAHHKSGERPFLNLLWVRDLAGRYQNTLLGYLLTSLHTGKAPANLEIRPGGALM
jgi:hypothetical protein